MHLDIRTGNDLLLYIYGLEDQKLTNTALNDSSRFVNSFVSDLLRKKLIEPCDYQKLIGPTCTSSVATAYRITAKGAELAEQLCEIRQRNAKEDEEHTFQREFQEKTARKETRRFWIRLIVDVGIALVSLFAGAFLQYKLMLIEFLLGRA